RGNPLWLPILGTGTGACPYRNNDAMDMTRLPRVLRTLAMTRKKEMLHPRSSSNDKNKKATVLRVGKSHLPNARPIAGRQRGQAKSAKAEWE
ncbi:hypothetical protein LM597_00655, partial [Candidatus Acetothermia bacterium]|nr:hypothetical protein [Candidatus Acetothermia bacterium]